MKIYESVITKVFTFQASCKAVDSRLVEIESEAEDVFVRALAMKLTGKSIFFIRTCRTKQINKST